jgi:ribosome-associated toxin RatA of RatAB toxin-antitoxin module
MSKHEYVARFEQPPDVIFGLLIDAERHNRIVPFCKSVAVTERRTAADGRSETAMRHLIVIQRVGIETDVRSILRHQATDRTIELVSQIGDGGGSLKSTGQVSGDGTGSHLALRLDISALPLRYRLLLVEPVLRRAHAKFVEKLTRRAAEIGGVQRRSA